MVLKATGVCIRRTSIWYAVCNRSVLTSAPVIASAVDVTAPEVLSSPTNVGAKLLNLLRGNASVDGK